MTYRGFQRCLLDDLCTSATVPGEAFTLSEMP
jgi:hypothetical protein